ncbi:MAG: hypothetical protein HFP81_08415 [Methylococcales symbiont of Hymedesmia sp. n. MRB-2018]|nr:MAG: hypothetical protein HFP78_08635 [Methylococcales symbiont of Hymedesmia sp. n. MRB-2018]KAF3983199.1 MAG: hypothetical protein HFP81_08415 [Methylococcales symbiont of Hymedesmia sp. n. MRB-2018]
MKPRVRTKHFSNFSIIEVFGGTFALLVVLFVILNIFSEAQIQQRLAQTIEEGEYKISWEKGNEGYIVIAFPSYMLIVQQQKKVDLANICASNSAFVNYARQIYADKKKQIVFAIVENATLTMRAGRDCMRQIFPKKPLSIAWIIANNELLKSVSIDNFPAYIKQTIK